MEKEEINEEKMQKIIREAFFGLMIVLELVVGFILLKKDMVPVFRWWLMLLLLELGALPLTALLFRKFSDRGCLFGKLLGGLIPAWLLWLMASLNIATFSTFRVIILSFAVLAAIWVVSFVLKNRASEEGSEKLSLPSGDIFLRNELVFTSAFLLFCYIKCYNPDAFGTERMMDYGFMQSIYRSAVFPPQDFWFAGESLNYYYFGQYFCTFLCKLSLNTVSYGYNIALSMCFAFCFSFAFTLLSQWMEGRDSSRKSVAIPVAVFGGVVLCGSASVHYLIFNFLVPWLWDILAIPGEKPSYWYADSTRYIGYHPETNDRTAHEYPAYSFLLGDLHAHVINIFVVLTILALLYAIVLEEKEHTESWKKTLADPKLWALGFLLGICMMENAWDCPIYYVVAGAVLLSLHLRSDMHGMSVFRITALQGVSVVVSAILVSLPFHLGFKVMADGIMRAENHTPLYQLAILWGLPLCVLVRFFASLLEKKTEGGLREWLRGHNSTDVYVLLLGFCGAGLILIPELIYVADIYSGDFKRFNTMFKLSYQAFILLNLVMAYVIGRFVLCSEKESQRRVGIRAGILLSLCCGYFLTALRMSAGDILDYSRYKGLEADRYLDKECEEDADAVYWARENLADGTVLLEANGSSYTIYNRASVITGLPTVLGWHTHEWLWHNSLDPVDEREEAVRRMYVDADAELMRQYGVEYIFLGSCEYEKYGPEGMDAERLRALGEVVYTAEQADEQGHHSCIIRLASQ